MLEAAAAHHANETISDQEGRSRLSANIPSTVPNITNIPPPMIAVSNTIPAATAPHSEKLIRSDSSAMAIAPPTSPLALETAADTIVIRA